MSEAPEMEYQEEQEFTITDDQTADWAIRKIREADAELERMQAWYESQLKLVQEKHDQTVNFFTAKLAQYMSIVPAKDTKTTRKYALASGEMVLTKAKEDFSVTDDEALLGWCQVNAPELVRVTMKPAWSDIKKRMKATDGGIADTETGMIVEGVEIVTKPESFAIKTK